MEHLTCHECGKVIMGQPVTAKPNRTLLSPKPPALTVDYCSQECKKLCDHKRYKFYALLDRNASDSECFQFDHWEGKERIGRCKITGKEVRVEPLQPGNNSGQPIECYEHFKLRGQYE